MNGSDHFVLRNAGVHMTISKGQISSLIDEKQKSVFRIFFCLIHALIQNPFSRELIPEGLTGGLVTFQDQPNY